jgi:hypothetical protein
VSGGVGKRSDDQTAPALPTGDETRSANVTKPVGVAFVDCLGQIPRRVVTPNRSIGAYTPSITRV